MLEQVSVVPISLHASLVIKNGGREGEREKKRDGGLKGRREEEEKKRGRKR